MNTDLIAALCVSILANIILVAVNNYLIFAILTRFRDYMNKNHK